MKWAAVHRRKEMEQHRGRGYDGRSRWRWLESHERRRRLEKEKEKNGGYPMVACGRSLIGNKLESGGNDAGDERSIWWLRMGVFRVRVSGVTGYIPRAP